MANAARAVRARPLVMVVDDNPDILALFRDVLEDECDYVVTPHPDGSPTVEEIRLVAPDVVVIDHRLAGGVLGWDIVRAIRNTADLDQLPILFCTADRRQVEAVADELTQLRVTPLLKPFNVNQLVGDVAEALRIQGIDPAPCP